MKTIGITILLLISALISSCQPTPTVLTTPPTEEPEGLITPTGYPEDNYPLLTTSMGEFIIVSARLVDEVHDTKAPPGDKFLLIQLARPGNEKIIMGEFPLEEFQEMVTENSSEISVLGNNGTQAFNSGMGGWLNEDEFVMGFTIFQPIPETFTLYWEGNTPIELNIEYAYR